MRFSLLFTLIPFSCFIAGYCIMQQLLHTPSIIVPHLIGLSIEDALLELSNHNLYATSICCREDAELPPHMVVEQYPSAGSQIKPQQAVIITASTVPATQTAPYIMGYHRSKVATITQIRTRYHPVPCSLAEGHCYAQYPYPGAHVSQGSIEIYYSAPIPTPRIMPNLKGLPALQVSEWLTAIGVPWSIVHQEPTPWATDRLAHTCATCIVGDQNPAPGSILSTYPRVFIQLLATEQPNIQ